MADSLWSTPICSFETSNRPGIFQSVGRNSPFLDYDSHYQFQTGIISTNCVGRKVFQINEVCRNSKARNFRSFGVKATDNGQDTKPKSIVCPICDANGAISCTQCQGTGVNSVDHFNGQFKAGGLCWLCRGKKDILCGNCNGAGFLGGFVSSFDD